LILKGVSLNPDCLALKLKNPFFPLNQA
jgi:hypothetical protein